jgi:hypothetical protein
MPVKGDAIDIIILVWDFGNNCGKTGQEANITLRAVGDLTEYTPSAPSINEIDATNRKGEYSVSLIAAENNYNVMSVGGILTVTVTDCEIIPTRWINDPIDFTTTQKSSLDASTPASIQGAVLSVTNAVTTTSDTQIDNIEADTNELQGLITSSKLPAQVKGIDNDMITAASLKTDAIDEITAAIWAKVIDGSITFGDALTLLLAKLPAKQCDVAGNVYTYKDQSGATILTVTIAATQAVGSI